MIEYTIVFLAGIVVGLSIRVVIEKAKARKNYRAGFSPDMLRKKRGVR